MRTRHNTVPTPAWRRWLFLAVPALAALALTLALTLARALPASAAASTIHLDSDVPISVPLFDTCTGQTIMLSGDIRIQANVVIDNTGGTGSGVVVIGENAHVFNFIRLTGTDEQGVTYIVNEEEHLVLNGRVFADGSGREEASEPSTFVLVSQGATPNLNLHLTQHFTLNANGTMTADVLDLNIACNG